MITVFKKSREIKEKHSWKKRDRQFSNVSRKQVKKYIHSYKYIKLLFLVLRISGLET